MDKFLVINRPGYWIMLLMPLISLLNIYKVVEIGSLAIRPIDLLFVIGWLVWLRDTFLQKEKSSQEIVFLLLIGFYVVGLLLGTIFVNSYEASWAKSFRFLQTVLWGGLALAFIKTKGDVEGFMISVVIAGMILGGFSLGYYVINPELHRVAAYFSAADGEGLDFQASYNEIGALHVLCIAMALRLRHFPVNNQKDFWITAALVLNFVGLFLGQSRSSMLALLLIGGCYLAVPIVQAFTTGKLPRNFVGIMVSVAILTVVLIMLPEYLTINRITDTFDSGTNANESMLIRTELWKNGLDVWTLKPLTFLLGFGSNSLSDYLIGGFKTSENFFIDQGIAGGLVGLIIAFFLLLWPIIEVLLRKKNSRLIFDVTLIAFIVSLTGNVLVDPFYGGVTFASLYGAMNVYAKGVAG